MADRYAVKSGNWSDPTVWDGGTLPGVDDVVRPNNFTVEIDQDIAVDALRGDAVSPAVQGGGFTVSSTGGGTRQIVGHLLSNQAGNFTRLLTISAIDGVIEITGDVSRSLRWTQGCYALHIASVSGNASVIVNGNVGGEIGNNGNAAIYHESATCALTINGDVTGGSYYDTSYGVYLSTSGSVTVHGDVYAAAATAGIYTYSRLAIVDVDGDLFGSPNYPAVYANASIYNRIRGNVYSAANGRLGLRAPGFILPSDRQIFFQLTDDSDPINGNPVLLANYTENSPPPEHVRDGTVYGPASSLTGTMAIPTPEDVANGVSVDDAVGEAVATTSDVWDHEVSAGVQTGNRLLSTATPAVVASQIAAVTNDG